jgi:hypothetical protein
VTVGESRAIGVPWVRTTSRKRETMKVIHK